MLVLAHRGYHHDVPENTLAAFQAACDGGADGIETDVRKSADNILLLYHDRISPTGKAISNMTHHQLNNAVGYKVPTLEDALSNFKEGIIWNFEIKTTECVSDFVNIMRPLVKRQEFFITSFIHDVVREVCNEISVRGGLLVAHDPGAKETERLYSLFGSTINSIVMDFEAATADTLQSFKRARVDVYLYNVGGDAAQEVDKGLLQGVIVDDLLSFRSAGNGLGGK